MNLNDSPEIDFIDLLFKAAFQLNITLRVVETEMWDLKNGTNWTIEPTVNEHAFTYGIGLYFVPFNFCNNQ